MKITELQIRIMLTMHKYNQQVGRRMDYSAVDLSDRGLEDILLSSLGVSMKGLVKKGLLEIAIPAKAKGHQRAKYRLTVEGKNYAKFLIADSWVDPKDVARWRKSCMPLSVAPPNGKDKAK